MVVAFQVAGKAITEQSNQIPHNTAITTSLKEIAFLKKNNFWIFDMEESGDGDTTQTGKVSSSIHIEKQFSLSLPDNWFFSESPTFPTCPN